MIERARSIGRSQIPQTHTYGGSLGTAWFAGFEPRAASIAAFFCGDDAKHLGSGRVLRRQLPDRIDNEAGSGGLAVLRSPELASAVGGLLDSAVAVPAMVNLHRPLPTDTDTLRTQLVTSTTREDFRRIRKAGFTFRIADDAETVRKFHATHYTPLVAQRFPDDGRIKPLNKMLDDLDRGGELVCAEIDGEWVAGLLNVRGVPRYSLMSLGIRNADHAIRQKRVVAALLVRSLERAVELGASEASLGGCLPFLGKGPVWFKAKWGGIIHPDSKMVDVHMFMDLRHAAVRRMLTASPVIVRDGDVLAAALWLEPGDQPLADTARDAGRFPGISRWYVLGDPGTIIAGEPVLSTNERIVPVPVVVTGDEPRWLGTELATRTV